MKEPDRRVKVERTAEQITRELLEEQMFAGKRKRKVWNAGTAKPKEWRPRTGLTCNYNVVDDGQSLGCVLVRILGVRYRVRPDGTKTEELEAHCQQLDTGELIVTPLLMLTALDNIVKSTTITKPKEHHHVKITRNKQRPYTTTSSGSKGRSRKGNCTDEETRRKTSGRRNLTDTRTARKHGDATDDHKPKEKARVHHARRISKTRKKGRRKVNRTKTTKTRN